MCVEAQWRKHEATPYMQIHICCRACARVHVCVVHSRLPIQELRVFKTTRFICSEPEQLHPSNQERKRVEDLLSRF